MRRLLPFLTLFALLSLTAVTRAGDSAHWTAWLHYGRHMTLIDSNGDVLREVDLPVPDDNQTTISDLAVSHNGRLVIYPVETPEATELLYVYDLIENTFITMNEGTYVEYPYTLLETAMFNETDTAFAVGHYNICCPELNNWRISVYDLQTGEVKYQLLNEIRGLAGMHGANPGVRQQFTPQAEVLNYENTHITFTIREKVDNQYLYKSFVWNVATDEIYPDIAYPNSFAETLEETGEVISAVEDIRFPILNIPFTVLTPFNTQQVYDPLTHSRFPFYATYGYPYFVQNGERVLLTGRSFTKPDIMTFTLIERDGNLLDTWELPSNYNIGQIESTPDGFLYHISVQLADVWPKPALPAVFEVNTRDDSLDMGRAVWSMNVREFQAYFDRLEDARLDIAWVHADAPVGPFKPWEQLAEPVYAPTPETIDTAILPTALPPPIPLFQVGHEVRVQTIDGEILNLRADPTRESDILVYVYDDMVLMLLDGPVFAEGFTWWRVRLPDGMEGWVVENDGELQTLIPI